MYENLSTITLSFKNADCDVFQHSTYFGSYTAQCDVDNSGQVALTSIPGFSEHKGDFSIFWQYKY